MSLAASNLRAPVCEPRSMAFTASSAAGPSDLRLVDHHGAPALCRFARHGTDPFRPRSDEPIVVPVRTLPGELQSVWRKTRAGSHARWRGRERVQIKVCVAAFPAGANSPVALASAIAMSQANQIGGFAQSDRRASRICASAVSQAVILGQNRSTISLEATSAILVRMQNPGTTEAAALISPIRRFRVAHFAVAADKHHHDI